jgi:hypothetical protein
VPVPNLPSRNKKIGIRAPTSVGPLARKTSSLRRRPARSCSQQARFWLARAQRSEARTKSCAAPVRLRSGQALRRSSLERNATQGFRTWARLFRSSGAASSHSRGRLCSMSNAEFSGEFPEAAWLGKQYRASSTPLGPLPLRRAQGAGSRPVARNDRLKGSGRHE